MIASLMYLFLALSLHFSIVATTAAFIALAPSVQRQQVLKNIDDDSSCKGRWQTFSSVGSSEEDCEIASSSSSSSSLSNPRITISSKMSIRDPLSDDRGKGGVFCIDEKINALEVLARIPRNEIIATCDMATASSSTKAVEAAANANMFSWATDLTAAALVEISSLDDNDDNDNNSKEHNKASWINAWTDGGWATNNVDLGPDDIPWGPKCVTGSLLSTGSDNDHNVYAKFRMPCHPTILRASKGLAFLTGCTDDEAREALSCRGKHYRSMRDALLVLVETPSMVRWGGKGSIRERRSWDVADMMNKVLSRVTTMELSNLNDDDEEEGSKTTTTTKSYCIVPLHERLQHCGEANNENTKLVVGSSDNDDDEEEILLVATRDIDVGEAITRNYNDAPKLNDDASDGPLRLLLQFGLPPTAWSMETEK